MRVVSLEWGVRAGVNVVQKHLLIEGFPYLLFLILLHGDSQSAGLTFAPVAPPTYLLSIWPQCCEDSITWVPGSEGL